MDTQCFELRFALIVQSENLKLRNYLGDDGVDGRLIFKIDLKEIRI
jgi:hypothetical protein